MHKPELEIINDRKYLTVFYSKELDNFNEAIESALERFGLEPGDCGILCLPIRNRKEYQK